MHVETDGLLLCVLRCFVLSLHELSAVLQLSCKHSLLLLQLVVSHHQLCHCVALQRMCAVERERSKTQLCHILFQLLFSCLFLLEELFLSISKRRLPISDCRQCCLPFSHTLKQTQIISHSWQSKISQGKAYFRQLGHVHINVSTSSI